MRVFVFAIGGTGSRVLTSLIMQLAAGVRPVDKEGKIIQDLSIVPILVDPHEDNSGLQQATQLLGKYRSIHKSIYGEELNKEGFFSVKIETLWDVNPANVSADKFFFEMQRVSDNRFGKFIGLDEMDEENQLFAHLLFSKDELETNMREGFYGSPNIGCVALNEFKKSKDFDAFRSAYCEGDKLFFIGSIFGGTGAAGLPLFITSIRDLEHVDNEDGGKTRCSEAPIGALIVMPYFSIAMDEKSPINDTEFTIKTRSALRYYETNLNRYINNVYYIADPKGTEDFVNDPGKENQKGNKAHIVEFVGALSLFNFIESENKESYKDDLGRIVARRTEYKRYGLEKDASYISFNQLPKSTNRLCMEPMMKFYLLRKFMGDHLLNLLDKPFAKKFNPQITRSIKSRDLDYFFKEYDGWCGDMKSHGTNAHNLSLFETVEDDYTAAFKEIVTQKRVFGGAKKVNTKDIYRCLDSVAQKTEYSNLGSQESRWFIIANEAIQQIISENYEYSKQINS